MFALVALFVPARRAAEAVARTFVCIGCGRRFPRSVAAPTCCLVVRPRRTH